ncbi:MAG: apolipoprotein N-acyltransferase, partial [Spirochaetales bacterium]
MKKILIDLALLVGGAILFAIPHPSILFYEGLPFLSYFSVIPLFLLTRRLPWKTVWLWGLIYGALCYCLYVHWLVDFHPLGMPVIAGLFGIQYIFLFIVLKAVWVLCGKYGWIAQWIIWCAYEFLKTQGFAGFSYGVTAYSHWQLTTLIQCTNILGIWGLSAIITFPSAWLSIIIQPIFDIRKTSATKETYKILPHIYAHRISAIAWVAVYAVIIIYGLVSPIDYSDYETKTVALIQVNSDPWVGGSVAYRRDLTTLTKLTDAALAENNAVDFVVWSETAFVPSIRWHYKYREDRVRIDLVMELLNYIENTGIPFVIGNGDTMVDYNAAGMYERISYNSVFLFRPGENVIPPNPEIYMQSQKA